MSEFGVVEEVKKMRSGPNKGLWMALRTTHGKAKRLGFWLTKEDAEESFKFNKPLSHTVAGKAFKKNKIDLDAWNEISKMQVKKFSELYR